jgi:hypothetical protein
MRCRSGLSCRQHGVAWTSHTGLRGVGPSFYLSGGFAGSDLVFIYPGGFAGSRGFADSGPVNGFGSR